MHLVNGKKEETHADGDPGSCLSCACGVWKNVLAVGLSGRGEKSRRVACDALRLQSGSAGTRSARPQPTRRGSQRRGTRTDPALEESERTHTTARRTGSGFDWSGGEGCRPSAHRGAEGSGVGCTPTGRDCTGRDRSRCEVRPSQSEAPGFRSPEISSRRRKTSPNQDRCEVKVRLIPWESGTPSQAA